MTKYELLYIIRPNIDDVAKTALVERFDKVLTDNGATIVESKTWEKRRLAYEIQDFKEGIYHIVNLEAETNAAALSEFDRLASINSDILRQMFVVVDEFVAPRAPKSSRRSEAKAVEATEPSNQDVKEVAEVTVEAE